MRKNEVADAVSAADRQQWFAMLVSYMKLRTLAVWLYYWPDTQYESFELIWPTLFDRMLAHATRAALKQLAHLPRDSDN